MFLYWNAGTVIGVMTGSALGDPRVLGLDAVLPAAMLLLLMPMVRSRRALLAAVIGGGLALATAPLLGAGVPILVAGLGAVLALYLPEGET